MPLHPCPCTFLPLPRCSQHFNYQEPRAFAQITHVGDQAPAARFWPLRSPTVPHVFMYLLKYIRMCLNRLSLPLTGIYLSIYLSTYLPMCPTTSLTHMNHARGWVWFLVVVVLRALGREREGAWVWVG